MGVWAEQIIAIKRIRLDVYKLRLHKLHSFAADFLYIARSSILFFECYVSLKKELHFLYAQIQCCNPLENIPIKRVTEQLDERLNFTY